MMLWIERRMHNKAIKFVPITKNVASTGLPTRCFGSRLWRRQGNISYETMMKNLVVLCCVVLLSACTSTDMTGRLEQGKGGVPTYQFSDARTVEEIRALKPQAKIPLRIAVMPPSRWPGLTPEERDVIEKWREDIKGIGFAQSLEIVPKSLIPTCGFRSDSDCFLQGARAAGARMGADTILFLNDTTVTDSYVNPLSILNLTIVGMWFIPAHHRDSYSIYEA